MATLSKEIHVEYQKSNIDLRTHYTREAVIEFCKKTQFVKTLVNAVPMGGFKFSIPEFERFIVIDIDSVTVIRDGVELVIGDAPKAYEPYYVRETQSTFRIENTDFVDNSAKATLAIAPAYLTDVMHKTVYDQYKDVVLNGVRASLCFMSGQEWSDPQKADFYRRLFLEGIDNATGDVTRNYSRTQTIDRTDVRRDYF